jgi:hypothetical protein
VIRLNENLDLRNEISVSVVDRESLFHTPSVMIFIAISDGRINKKDSKAQSNSSKLLLIDMRVTIRSLHRIGDIEDLRRSPASAFLGVCE